MRVYVVLVFYLTITCLGGAESEQEEGKEKEGKVPHSLAAGWPSIPG